MAFNSLSGGFPQYLLPYQIYASYRYPFSALFLMQQGLFPSQTNDIILTSNPASPICTVCRNFTINNGVTYSQDYICVVATNSITVNGSIDCFTSSDVAYSFFNGGVAVPLSSIPSVDSDIPCGGGGYTNNGRVGGFGGGARSTSPSLSVNPPFSRVIYNSYSNSTILSNSLFISGIRGQGGSSNIAGGIVILCAPTININGNILSFGRNTSYSSANVHAAGGGVVYLVGNNITIGSININAKGGDATITSGNYSAFGGGGGFIVIAGTQSITNNATINVSGGTASGGTYNIDGQNGSLIVKTFSFYDCQL